jgi:hypothetical protein
MSNQLGIFRTHLLVCSKLGGGGGNFGTSSVGSGLSHAQGPVCAFGVIQNFPFDWEIISPDKGRIRGTVAVNHTVVVLVTIKSLLTSMMLSCSLHS